MRNGRVITWVLLVVVVVLLAGGITLYALVSHRPSDYRPAVLSVEQREQARQGLRQKIQAFIREAGDSSTWTATQPIDPTLVHTLQVTQAELNDWIASLPEEALAELNRLGFSDLAAAIDTDRLTFYAYSAEYSKVLGLDLRFLFDEQGMMTLQIKSIRIGELPMPRDLYDKQIARLVNYLQAKLSEAGRAPDDSLVMGIRADDFRKGAGELLKTAKGEPISPEVRTTWARIRLTKIELAKDLATISYVPVAGPGSAPGAPERTGR